MDSLRREDLTALFRRVAETLADKSEELGEMDALMGDGDLGLTMKKGFGALPEAAEALDEPDLGKAFMKLGLKLTAAAPSTMGFLLGAGFMAGGGAVIGRRELDAAGYALFLQNFADGVARRGRCAPGDRTVLDAVDAAAKAAAALLTENPGASLGDAANAAVLGAQAGAEATCAMKPKFGKAAVHAAAAEGVRDQGACAALYMLQGFRVFLTARALSVK